MGEPTYAMEERFFGGARRAVIGLAAGIALLGAGCSGAPGSTASADHVITIRDGKFTPQEITVRAGETVAWLNEDTELRWPASNPHPTHTGESGLDALGELRTGEVYSHTFNTPGTFGYHDHAVAKQGRGGFATGTVIVVP